MRISWATGALCLLAVAATQAQWTNGRAADAVLGKPVFNQGHANTVDDRGCSGPYDAAIDPTTGKVFVSDYYLHRVLRFSSAAAAITGSAAEAVLGQPDFQSTASGVTASTMNGPWGLACDLLGNLYVVDSQNNRVLRFNNAAAKANGAAADGVFGQGSFTSGGAGLPVSASNMYWPQGVAVDRRGNLYVGIYNQSRVMRFDSAATKTIGGAATVVFGQASLTANTQGTTATTMKYASGVAVDTIGTLWVSDNGNNRILRFDSAWTKSTGAAANGVLSAATFTAAFGDLSSPNDVALDPDGTLWVSCSGGVAKFVNARAKVNGADPELYINLVAASSQSSTPQGVAVDTAGTLYIADNSASRVARYNRVRSKTAPIYADAVLGKPDMISVYQNSVTGSGFRTPWDVAVDPVSGKVFVADDNNRILRFGSVHALTSGQSAEAVLGQQDLLSAANLAVTATSLNARSLAVDAAGRLWVAGSRVLRFDNAATKPNFAPADGVLGQPDFVSNTKGTSAALMNNATGIAVFRTTLYVADYQNHRILRFDSAAFKPNGSPANGVLGQTNFTTATGGTTQGKLAFPCGLAVDQNTGTLYVADLGNNRVVRFDSAHVKPDGAPADGVLGQSTFTTKANSPSQTGLVVPTDVALDGQGTLYVSEESPNRVMIFKDAAALPNGAAASNVLGHVNFTDMSGSTTSSTMYKPYGLAVVNTPTGRLLVADTYNGRVLRFTATGALTDVEEASIPERSMLLQNYPNPFNPSTTIVFALAQAEFVSVVIYDMLGREVATVAKGNLPAGMHQARFSASGLSSGMYLVVLQTKTAREARRLMLLK